ncbi:ectopic P granules protein 5 homolog [Harmonia axyridis]|uniref:ectopic P granules protein 5 homolog n=1 Tax=Harmonia axyridis TaxID=115357 RepID=UPI001E278A2C|nr:ectopic P granules protein 5 homolog [Harmonia axyridis]
MEQVRKKPLGKRRNKLRKTVNSHEVVHSQAEQISENPILSNEGSETMTNFHTNDSKDEDNSEMKNNFSQNTIVKSEIEHLNFKLSSTTINADDIKDRSDNVENKSEIQSAVYSAIRPYAETQLAAFYSNNELSMIENFSQQFIEAELQGLAIKSHSLYEMLCNYLDIRLKLIETNKEINQLKAEYVELKTKLWISSSENISSKGKCQHGDIVSVSHSYLKYSLNKSAWQSMQRILANIQKSILKNLSLYHFSAGKLKYQIEIYLQTIIAHCLNVTQLNKDKEIILNLQKEPEHWKPYLNDLRLCVSVLFAFQRKLIKDDQFIDETRAWLKRLIAVLLRVANYQDHLFLLNHVLRCPAGVGLWASSFVQTPLLQEFENPFMSYEINHVLAVLSIILSPVKDRDKFLGEVAQQNNEAQDALWVVIDSDGEEDEETSGTSLRENDLVALLNQLPLGSLFRALSLLKQRHNLDHYADQLTEQHILRFFAFSTLLLRIINKGLHTYNQPRYNQFAKRLSRLILHLVQYATDLWERFCSTQTIDDSAMMQRLQVEYDAFFFRAVYCLYSSQKLGAWQFLAVVPYNLVSSVTLWKIFFLLHGFNVEEQELFSSTNLRDFRARFDKEEFKDQFLDKLITLPDGEIYYLLNTFANIALARTEEELIIAATMDLLLIGFINEITQDVCSKTSRILLTHITSKHPHLLSRILKQVMENINYIQDLSLYLYEELPLAIWKVNNNDIDLLSRLIRTESESQIETKLARMIISRLNWDINGDGSLFLPYKIHCDIAMLVLQAVDETPAFTNWGWQTILRLKLHISDNGLKDIKMVADIDNYDILLKGIRERKPLHAFVALLMTSWGHLIPIICTNGFAQLLFLESQQKYEAVLFALYLIMPLFLNAQECIVNSLEFQEILSNLLYVDQSYISMAKSFIGAQNTVLQQFGNMIETQMNNYHNYNLDSPRILVRLWMNSLVSVEQWTRNYGVLYLLDVIIKASFFQKDAIEAATNVLKELLQDTTPQEQGGTISSIFKWVSASNQNVSLISSSLSPFPWLAYIMIGIEHEEREKKTGLWKELLQQLYSQKGKVNVDSAIKKAAGVLKINSVSSASLCIYRYAQLAMDTTIDHPIGVLIWQKFFELYFDAISTPGSFDRRSIGDKFFEGVINFAFLKKLKYRLQETKQYYQNKIYELEEAEDNWTLPLMQSGSKLYSAFALWLEEPRLHKANTFLRSFPFLYETDLLQVLFEGDKTPWYSYVAYNRVKAEQQESIRIWRISNFREHTNVNKPLLNPEGRSQSNDPIERMLSRIESYEHPKPAPTIEIEESVVPIVDTSSVRKMFHMLEKHFTILKFFAKDHSICVNTYESLNRSYQELIPMLYKLVHVVTKKVAKCNCKETKQRGSCAEVIINILYDESRLDERTNHLIQSNRHEYEFIFDLHSTPAPDIRNTAIAIEHTIKILQHQVQCDPSTRILGVELFYSILKLINEKTMNYLPTKTLFVDWLEKLGQSHLCGVESEISRLLDTILEEPNLGEFLAPHFAPGNTGTANLLLMYEKISNEIGQKYEISFALLSKFDIDKWLQNKKPKLNERSQFIELVVKGLSTLGTDPPVEALTLHGLYRKHLLSVFQFQFPEHYGEILVNLLRTCCETSNSCPVAISVWLDILNSLSFPTQIHPRNALRDQLRAYAQNQQKLNYREILETSELLSGHFTQERLQYGLYGLYPKCEQYLDIYCLLLGMSGHSLIISSLNVHQGLESDKMCEKIWPHIRDMFAPWIAPYSMQNLKDYMASWIQQLTDDRSVLLPWIPSNVNSAQKMLDCFKECILFLLHILPACSIILNYIWQWYVTTYAHGCIKEHILNSIHQTLLVLPWANFWPSLTDLEAMLRIVDQYLPECHQFLGQIFISVQWMNWMNQFINCPIQIKSRVYHCYISLLVKLSNEPNLRSQHVEKFNNLLVQSENLDWTMLDPVAYQNVMDWYIMSCDSNVIFKSDPLDLDVRVLQFLKTISGYDNVIEKCENPNISNRRYIYVRSFVKLISVYNSKNKLTVPSRESEISSMINNNIKHMECVVKSKEELNIILPELLNMLNVSPLGDISLKCFSHWISKKSGNSFVIHSLLHVSVKAVKNYEFIAQLYELCLECYFQNVNEHHQPSWTELRQYVKIVVNNQIELEQILLAKKSILTLNLILLEKINCCTDYQGLLNMCIDWLPKIKMGDSVENKIPLIWLGILNIALKYCEVDESAAGGCLYKFSQILLQIAEDKGNSSWGRGILSVIGISKADSVSLPFKFLCRALGGYILAQLPEMKGKPQIVRRHSNAPAKVGQPGGNTECAKILLKLDFGQSQGKLKEYAELALNEIQDPTNSLHNVADFLTLMTNEFSDKLYFKDLSRN